MFFKYLFCVPGAGGFSSKSTAQQVADKNEANIRGRTFVITGCSAGIGKETVRVLASKGGRVIMACRPGQKAKDAFEEVKRQVGSNAQIGLMDLDLGSMTSIRAFARAMNDKGIKVNVLINNGAVMACPRSLTTDGFENQIGTNHLGHFLLTILLLDSLQASGPDARVVNVASVAHRMSYKGGVRFDDLKQETKYDKWQAYGQAKLCNVLHAAWLNKLLKESSYSNITAYALHPGCINTNLQRHMSAAEVSGLLAGRCIMKSIPQGAATTLYCAVDPHAAANAGGYFSDCDKYTPSGYARDVRLQERLWQESARLVNADFPRAASAAPTSQTGGSKKDK